MIQVLILDEDKLNRKRIKQLLNNYGSIFIINECSEVSELEFFLINNTIDLLISDINFNNDVIIFDFLEKFSSSADFLTIIVSEDNNFALKAFEYQIFDYLLKPFSDVRFVESIQNFIKNHLTTKKEISNKETLINHDKFPLKLANKILFINNCEIKYIKASGGYSEVYTKEKKFVIREAISKFDNMLPNSFIRIHRSTIVNVEFIKEVMYSNYGDLTIKIDSGELLRIGKTYKSNFKSSTKI